MWVLATEADAEPSLTFRILPGNIKTVGRAPRADFIVDASLVSRVHCRLSAGAAELEVVDLDSTNGTFVNGQRVSRAVLRDGDTLGVGRVELVIKRPGTDSSASPSRSSSDRHDPGRRRSHPES